MRAREQAERHALGSPAKKPEARAKAKHAARMSPKSSEEERARQAVADVFARCDLNKNGTIEKTELKLILGDVGDASLPEDTIDRIMTAADLDEDGVIDFNEFLKWVWYGGDLQTRIMEIDEEVSATAARKLKELQARSEEGRNSQVSSVKVAVISMGGSFLLDPFDAAPSMTIDEVRSRVLRAQSTANFVSLYLDAETPKSHSTVQELVGSEGSLCLTGILEYRLTDEERADYIKKLKSGTQSALNVFKDFPDSARADAAVVMEAIRRDWQAVQYATGSCGQDRDFILMAVRVNRRTLQYASDELKCDRNLVLEATALNGYALAYADQSLRADPEFIMEAVRRNGSALEFADQSLKSNKDIVSCAVRESGMALDYADWAMKADRQVVTEAVRQAGYALQHADPYLQNDKKIVIAAVRQAGGSALKYASSTMQMDRDVLAAAGITRWR